MYIYLHSTNKHKLFLQIIILKSNVFSLIVRKGRIFEKKKKSIFYIFIFDEDTVLNFHIVMIKRAAMIKLIL